jgi:hypothetical protein
MPKHVVPAPKKLSTAEYWFQYCSSLWSHASTTKISATNGIFWLLTLTVCFLGYRYNRRRQRETHTKTAKASISLLSRPPRGSTESSRSSVDSNDDNDNNDATLNAEIRAKAAQAALNRSAAHESKRLALQKKHQQEQLERATREHSAAALCVPCASSNASPSTIASQELLPLYNDGLTIVRHIPTLPRADTVAGLLHQLAVEFVPILRSRHYDVVSISEFCCCGDGMEYELGQGGCGRTLGSRARPGQRIAGHESTTVAGYNQLHQSSRSGRVTAAHHSNSIHLRLRHPPPTPHTSNGIHADTTTNARHHYAIISYSELCLHMAHELAHCVHRHHGPEFQALMRDIQSEYETRYSWR